MKRLTPEVIFGSSNIRSNLAGKSVSSGMSVISAQIIQFMLRTAGTVVLARLLTPGDFGLVGMVTVVVNFAQLFKDAGLSMATVQRDSISQDQISTLFWINIVISGILGLCVLAASPLLAAFYGKPELTAVTAVLSVSFIISGLSIQHAALLRRHMHFAALAGVQIGSQVLNLTLAIVLARSGFGYWSLVFGSLMAGFTTVVLTFVFCPWLPGRMKKGTGVRDMLRFGGNLTGFNFINYFSRNADKLLIGKLIGAEGLGIYEKAYQLFMLPISEIRGPITNVAIPVLSSLQDEPVRFLKYYRRLLDILAFLTFPVTVYCIMEADFLIRLVLGPQWMDAAPVFRVLAIAGLFQPTSGTAGLVLLSLGYASRLLKIASVTGALTVFSFIAGIPHGIIGVATAYAIISYIILLPMLFCCFHKTPVTIGVFLRAHVAPILISLTSAGFFLFTKRIWGTETTFSHLASLTVYLIIFTGVACCLRSVREIIWHTFALARTQVIDPLKRKL